MKKDVTFEDALKELEAIVSSMESGEMSLDDTVKAYTRGTELTRLCQSKLDDAQAKIQKLTASGTLEDFKVDTTTEEVPF